MLFMKKILVSFMLLLLSMPVLAEMEVIELKHRSAEEVLPVIRPLLDKDEAASGMNYQLILRTSKRNLAQIREILEKIDVAPRRLKITVMQNVDSETVARLTEVSGNVRLSREARISVPGSGNQNIEIGQGNDRLRARVSSTRSVDDERNTQQLQVLEGRRALVHSGQSVAVPQRQVIQNQWGTRVIESTQYQEAGSGFYVLPRISGDLVTLEISTQNDAFVQGTGDSPEKRVRQTSSIISGHLGEWLEVGGVSRQKNGEDSAIISRGSTRVLEKNRVLLKVEEIE